MGDRPTQSGNGVRFEWGPTGADRLVSEAACPVVVDVLSFTTAVSVAVGKGTRVFPFRWPGRDLTTHRDLLGAGALVSELNSQGAGPASPEAADAKAACEGTADIAHVVAAGSSGRQLAAMGFVEDVAIAAEEDTCPVAPVRDGDGALGPG